MDNITQKITYDEKDPKFIQLKQEFLKEIKTYFNCESFDKVIQYVFEEVFEKKITKEASIEKFQSIFENKTEKIMNCLWDLIERISSSPKGDVLDEIFREKNEPKKFPSQIVNPSSNKPHSSSQSQSQGQSQNPQGGDRDYHNRRDNRRKGSRDYRDYKDNRDYNKNRRGNKFSPGDRMRGGNKEGGYHGSNRLERSRDRNEGNYQSHPQRDKEEEGDYDDNYHHHQNYRGGYNQRRGGGYPMPFNPYYPTFPPMMGYVDPRRSKINPKRPKGEGQEGDQDQQKAQQVGGNKPITAPSNEDPQLKQQGTEEGKAVKEAGAKGTEGEKAEGQKKKVRCKNWPNCKEQGCEYSHPTQTCPFFPNCMFGDKCSYIHPNIKCKYGFNCTRINCAYSHPVGYNPGMGMFPNMMRPIPHFKFKGKKNFGNKNHEGGDQPQEQPQQQEQDKEQEKGENNQ